MTDKNDKLFEDEEVTFLELLESANDELDMIEEDENFLNDECLVEMDESELEELREELDLTEEEFQDILESTKRRVSSRGDISRVRSKKSRKQRAGRTTGMGTAQRKRRARKAAKSRKRNPAGLRKAAKKRNKAMRKRKRMNL